MGSHVSKVDGNEEGASISTVRISGDTGGSTKRRHRRLASRLIVIVMGATIVAGWAGWKFFHRPRNNGIRNIVMISIDTCRADRLSCYGYKRQTTPNIDGVAREGVLFNAALTPVPLTLPAHSSMMTGMYPPRHGVHLNNGEHLAGSNLTLAEILKEAGYQTAAFVGAFVLDSRFGLNQGFDTYDFQKTTNLGRDNERRADEVNRPALVWLEKHAAEPFFLFVHYYDPHEPYEPPSPWTSLYADDLYAGEIAYVDSCIGKVEQRLRSLGAYDNTLLIIAGDHGESLGEHGEHTHGYYIYDSTLRVPLIIRTPRCRKGCKVEGNVSLVDIMPTVLDLVDLKIPAHVDGVSLRRCLEGKPLQDGQRAIFGESLLPATYGCGSLHGIVAGPWKYVRAPKQELYDLERDAGELTNVVDGEPQVARQLRARLESILREMDVAALSREPPALDPEAAKRLQALGYTGGGMNPSASSFDPAIEDPKTFLPTHNRLIEAQDLILTGQREQVQKELLDIVKQRPGLVMAYRLLAKIAMVEGRSSVAKQYFAEIQALLTGTNNVSPHIPAAEANFTMLCGHMDLAKTLVLEGKFDQAEVEYESALRIEPDAPELHNDLGNMMLQNGKLAEAIGHFERALQLTQRMPEAHYNLGRAMMKMGRLPEAVEHYEQALRIRPDYADAYIHLGIAQEEAGRLPEAVEHYTEAVRLNADELIALNNLAWIRATSANQQLRDGAEAVRLAERAAQLTGRKLFPFLDTLAAAYAETGRFPDAVAAAQDAQTLAKAAKQDSSAAEIGARLSLYLAGKPYRQEPRTTPARSDLHRTKQS